MPILHVAPASILSIDAIFIAAPIQAAVSRLLAQTGVVDEACGLGQQKSGLPLLPARIFAAGVGDDEAEEDVAAEPPDAERGLGNVGLRDLFHGLVKARVVHGLDEAGPAPVGGDEGLGEHAERLGQREHGAAQRELEADEIDGDERGLLGGFHQARKAEADGGERRIDEGEQDDLRGEAALELHDDIHENGHPHGLHEHEHAEEGGL